MSGAPSVPAIRPCALSISAHFAGVGGSERDLPPTQAADGGRRGFEFLPAARDEADRGAFGGKRVGYGIAEPLTRAEHHRNLPREPQVHRIPPSSSMSVQVADFA